MKKLRQNIAIRFLWFIMAIHILNVSVDTSDLVPANLPEDLSINDRESFAELFLEDILGIFNAVAEQDEEETEKITRTCLQKAIHSPYTYKYPKLTIKPPLADDSVIVFAVYFPSFLASVDTELLIPPPQA
jgi:hypothetical protein